MITTHLVKLVYHTAESLQYREHGGAKRAIDNRNRMLANERKKRKAQRVRDRFVGVAAPLDVCKGILMHEHFRTVLRAAGPDVVVSLDFLADVVTHAAHIDVDSLADTLSSGGAVGGGTSTALATSSREGPTPMPRMVADTGLDEQWEIELDDMEALAPVTPPQLLLVVAAGPAQVGGAPVHFQTVFATAQEATPGARKIMPLAPASGRRLDDGDIIMSMHESAGRSDTDQYMLLRPLPSGERLCNLVVSSGFDSEPQHLQTTTRLWTRGAVSMAIPGFLDTGCKTATMELCKHHAYPDSRAAYDLPRGRAGSERALQHLAAGRLRSRRARDVIRAVLAVHRPRLAKFVRGRPRAFSTSFV